VSAAFTPGPWQVNATVHCDRKNIFGLNPTAAFHVGTLVSGSKSKLDLFEANARLIAAAPELYEALADTLPRNVCLTNGSVGTKRSFLLSARWVSFDASASCSRKHGVKHDPASPFGPLRPKRAS
jgi:hypothetical protein